MKRLFIAILLFTTIGIQIYAQVETRYYQNSDTIPGIKKSQRKTSLESIIKIPKFNLDKILKEDTEMDGEDVPYRFGKGFDVSYSLADGQWESVEDGRLWSLTFESEGAVSLNYIFENFYLPEGAYLYIENKERNVFYGPVTPEVFASDGGTFLTDIIPGSCSTIYLFEPVGKENESTLSIKRVVHGYRGFMVDSQNGSIRSSSDCNVDVACYPTYENESKGIALVLLSNGEEWCSGSLLMSTNLSFDPYLLTAFHCIDTNHDNTLSTAEKSVASNWMFKFCFKKTTCNGSSLATSYTYNKADFCAAWFSTDFALMKIKGNVSQNSNLTWLGWDRSGNTPTSGAGIHHPAGDVMKISIENNTFSTTSSDLGNNGWTVNYDYGILEGGSSGSPILDQNKRVVGQLYGGTHHANLCLQTDGWYGKFYKSWTGNTTDDDTKLSNWLYPINTGQTTMNSCHPISIVGNPNILTSNTYYVNNLPSGYTVTWSLSDNYYNSNCLQQNTPYPNQCTITRSSLQQMANGTLTATIKYNGITVRNLSMTGLNATGFTGTYYNGLTTKNINYPNPLYMKSNSNVYISSPQLVGATVTFSGSPSSTSWSLNSSNGMLLFNTPNSSYSTFVINVICANGYNYNLTIVVTTNSNLLNVDVSQTNIEVSILPVESDEQQVLNSPSEKNRRTDGVSLVWTLEVYNATTGEKVFSHEVKGSSFTIDTTDWRPGVYIVRAVIGDEVLSEKVVVR